MVKILLYFLQFAIFISLQAQMNNTNWYFGNFAGLSFNTNPPQILNNSAMSGFFGTATQSDENGNLLFYTDGMTVYNKSHQIMDNGTGLFGYMSTIQAALIIKKPGSNNLHYIFTNLGDALPGAINYSIVDMNLASGQGSVTVKNATVFAGSCTDRLAGTKHCNGIDYWVMVQEYSTNKWYCYLLTAGGLVSTPVISTVGPSDLQQTISGKFSSDGSKFAANFSNSPSGLYDFCIYDFDNSTGVLSNCLMLSDQTRQAYNFEFSPDGSKLYVGENLSPPQPLLHQWDLCAGSVADINNSHTTFTCSNMLGMQLANNGKIYCSTPGGTNLSVINNPNALGAACGYSQNLQSLGSAVSTNYLPNLVKSFSVSLTSFTYSQTPQAGCFTFSFNSGASTNTCASRNYSVVSVKWDFGDPASGPLNSSFLSQPSHTFSAAGTYTVREILYYKCSTDTLISSITVPPPFVQIKTVPNCQGSASGTVNVNGGIGPYTYTWLPGLISSSIAANLAAGQATVIVKDLGQNCLISTVVTVNVFAAPSLSVFPKNNLKVCFGSTGKLSVATNCASYSVVPNVGVIISGNSITLSPSISQNYVITAQTGTCLVHDTLRLQVQALPNATIIVNRREICTKEVLKLEALGIGTFSWTGPSNFNTSKNPISRLIESSADVGVYTLQVTDSIGCKSTTSVAIGLGTLPAGELRGLSETFCAPYCTKLDFLPYTNNTVATWKIGKQTLNQSVQYCFNEPRTYTVEGLFTNTNNGCVSNVQYLCTGFDKPRAAFAVIPDKPTDDQSEPIQLISLNNNISDTAWTWHINAASKSEPVLKRYGKAIELNTIDEGDYGFALVVKNNFGCSDTAIKYISVLSEDAFWAPNCFTPNDDNRNDKFQIEIRGVKFFHLAVFDRWGSQVYSTDVIGDSWDGSYQGRACKQDTYSWQASYTTILGEHKTKTGKVLLMR